MSSARRLMLLSLLAVCVGLTLQSSHPATARDLDVRSLLGQDGWGATLQTDRPFYRVGDAVQVRALLFNGSWQDAYGWSPDGCWARLQVLDERGLPVWDPLQVCTQALVWHDLSSGAKLPLRQRVPLVFDNTLGLGQAGQSLPPGSYQLRLDVQFSGPNRTQYSSDRGADFSSSVPIRVEGTLSGSSGPMGTMGGGGQGES